MTTAITKATDFELLTVDTSVIDVSEVEAQEDKDFLLEKGTNILTIIAKAALEVGQQIYEVQEHFKDRKRDGSLSKFYGSLGVTEGKAQNWANKYRAYLAYVEIFGGADEASGVFEKVDGTAMTRLLNLPQDYREALLADIALGDVPTKDKVREIANRPEVKLSKAEELLAAAKARKEAADEKWELVKADPNIPARDPEYKSAYDQATRDRKAVENYEQQIADLKKQVEEAAREREAAQQVAAENAEAQAKLQAEIDRLKYDDSTVREQRMRKVQNNLLASLPAVHADIQRFYAEIEHYEPDTIMFLEEQLKLLKSFVEEHL